MMMPDRLTLQDEFERSAAVRRRKLLEAELVEELHRDRRHEEAKREEEEQDRRFEEAAAATSEQIAAFHTELDRYDAGVVEALMENRRALDRAEDALADVRRRAFVLPDGRRVYKSQDGEHVFDEAGQSVGRDVVDPAAIDSRLPAWEVRRNAGEDVHHLTAEREAQLAWQERVDHAREHTARGAVSQADLTAIRNDLDLSMPASVRSRVGHSGQHEKLDGLLQGQAFDPNALRATTPSDALGKQPAPAFN